MLRGRGRRRLALARACERLAIRACVLVYREFCLGVAWHLTEIARPIYVVHRACRIVVDVVCCHVPEECAIAWEIYGSGLVT